MIPTWRYAGRLSEYFMNETKTGSSKMMLIQGHAVFNSVMSLLLSKDTPPKVAVLTAAPSDIVIGLLRQDGYDASPLNPDAETALEATGIGRSDLVLMDGGVLHHILSEMQGTSEEQLRISTEKVAWATELEARLEEQEKRCAALMQRNVVLEKAATCAQQAVQAIREIARKALSAAGWPAEKPENKGDST